MKLIKLFILTITTLLFFTACNSNNGLLLFNTQPINEHNITTDQKNFAVGSKIYYIYLAPRRMVDTDFIRVQVFKMTDKAALGGYDVVRTKDYRLMMDEHFYHTNYFVLHEKGRYVMQIFSHNDFVRPLAINDFFVY